MYQACVTRFAGQDIAILSAAVADFRPATQATEKIKKENGELTQLTLEKTPDILAELGKRKSNKQILVGFALETEHEVANAQKKLINKNLDFIVLNSLREMGAGFGVDTNKITLLDKHNNIVNFELKDKKAVARDIIENIKSLINATP